MIGSFIWSGSKAKISPLSIKFYQNKPDWSIWFSGELFLSVSAYLEDFLCSNIYFTYWCLPPGAKTLNYIKCQTIKRCVNPDKIYWWSSTRFKNLFFQIGDKVILLTPVYGKTTDGKNLKWYHHHSKFHSSWVLIDRL